MSVIKWLFARGLQVLGLIGAGFLVAMMVTFYSDHSQHPMMPPGRWLGWIVPTGILGFFLLRAHRNKWRRISFWMSLAALFGVHTIGYILLFKEVQAWRTGWFMPLMLVEYPVFMFVLDFVDARFDGGVDGDQDVE